MEARDLRVGNYVLDKLGYKCKIKTGEDIDFVNGFKPIKLTEEWLVNFGADKYDFDHKESQFRLKERLFVIRNGLFLEYGTSVVLKYVHQLQNLYFALTGEEITL